MDSLIYLYIFAIYGTILHIVFQNILSIYSKKGIMRNHE